jgi:hypothetical protein
MNTNGVASVHSEGKKVYMTYGRQPVPFIYSLIPLHLGIISNLTY